MRNIGFYIVSPIGKVLNKAELEKLEALSTGANLAWLQLHPIRGEFDFQHLKDIHYFIFQDVYDWAGQVRTIDIGKNNLFWLDDRLSNSRCSLVLRENRIKRDNTKMFRVV